MRNLFLPVALALSLTAAPAIAATQKASKPAAVSGMTLALRIGEKIGAPVDVYYQHLAPGPASADPSLKLSIVPRLAGKLSVQLVPDRNVSILYGGAPMTFQKASAAGVFSRLLSVRRNGTAPASIRALVHVDLGDSSFFSVFVIPADAASTPSKSQKAGVKTPAGTPARQL